MLKKLLILMMLCAFMAVAGNAFALFIAPEGQTCECTHARKIMNMDKDVVYIMCDMTCEGEVIAVCKKEQGKPATTCTGAAVGTKQVQCEDNDIATCVENALCSTLCPGNIE